MNTPNISRPVIILLESLNINPNNPQYMLKFRDEINITNRTFYEDTTKYDWNKLCELLVKMTQKQYSNTQIPNDEFEKWFTEFLKTNPTDEHTKHYKQKSSFTILDQFTKERISKYLQTLSPLEFMTLFVFYIESKNYKLPEKQEQSKPTLDTRTDCQRFPNEPGCDDGDFSGLVRRSILGPNTTGGSNKKSRKRTTRNRRRSRSRSRRNRRGSSRKYKK